MSLLEINAALVTAVQGAALGVPIGWESKEFKPPAGQPYATVKNFPADKNVHSLGDRGEDNYSGFLQINVHVPENDGTSNLNKLSDKIDAHFKLGRVFTYKEQRVRIRYTTFTPGNYVISHTIYWDSLKQR